MSINQALYIYQKYLQLLFQLARQVEVARFSSDSQLSLHVQVVGRGLHAPCGEQNFRRKALLSNLNRISGIFPNKIALMIKLLKFQIPKLLPGSEALGKECEVKYLQL